jgi:uncharacterized membrane protein
MIIFHFSFDLDHFSLIEIDIISDPFWYFFPRLIVFLFIFLTGMALTLVHNKKIKWNSFIKRQLLISFWAVFISLVTYYFFPQNWIYFGTLHAIAVISIMSLPFLNSPRISLLIAICLFIPSIFWDLTIPWFNLPHSSWDYISPFPWAGAALLGIFAVHKGFHKIIIPQNKLTQSINYMGRHSLIIYLIHQPILFSILILLSKIYRFL